MDRKHSTAQNSIKRIFQSIAFGVSIMFLASCSSPAFRACPSNVTKDQIVYLTVQKPAYITAIDNYRPRGETPSQIELAAGPHTVIVGYKGSDFITGVHYHSEGFSTMRFEAKAGRSYLLGANAGRKSKSMVENVANAIAPPDQLPWSAWIVDAVSRESVVIAK